MDDLLNSLNAVSIVLIPIVAVVCLILLGMFLYNLNKTVKRLSVTLDEVDKVIVSTGTKVDQLDGPLNTLNSVSKTVDVVNDTASNAFLSALKYSDSIINWGVEAFAKKKQGNNESEENKKEEDFGIYE